MRSEDDLIYLEPQANSYILWFCISFTHILEMWLNLMPFNAQGSELLTIQKKKCISNVKMHFKTPLLLGHISLTICISLIIWFTPWLLAMLRNYQSLQGSNSTGKYSKVLHTPLLNTTDLTFLTKNTRE